MPDMSLLQLSILLLNTGILTATYYKLGRHDELHKSHDSRLTKLESKGISLCQTK